ncbi:MAG TPA: hypothetical protein V6D17_17590 [Candidatus Obscuribacterales bacterium]
MKRKTSLFLGFTGAIIAILAALPICSLVARKHRIDEKVARVKMGINELVRNGKNADEGLNLLKRAKAAFDEQKAEEGEALVDAALRSLGTSAVPSRPAKYSLPAYQNRESFIDLYGPPAAVKIDGYDGDCMEPFVSGDGNYLFFNNSNDPLEQTHIHMARRTGRTTYRYLGLVSGTISQAKDMAPTIDAVGRFYFTSTRSYDKDGKSLYVGRLINQSVSGVTAVSGDITPRQPGWINMDCGVSHDGKTLYISRAQFAIDAPAPRRSDLLLANESKGQFVISPQSDSVLAAINTPALEYAPCISTNERELFFTRAGELMVAGQSQGSSLRIMVAQRKTKEEPFAEPKIIASIQGFVEAPTLTQDSSELFFHKKENAKFRIYRAVRKGR